jgi:apolipoprotein N-acyltransferase
MMICWESLFAEHARMLANDGATLLLMLANEGWFGDSPAAAQHNLTARMRAVETRRSVIVASNMGPPLVIDPYGRIIGSGVSRDGMSWATGTVPLIAETTLYTRLGDGLLVVCSLFLLAYTIGAAFTIKMGLLTRHKTIAMDSPHGVRPSIEKGSAAVHLPLKATVDEEENCKTLEPAMRPGNSRM